MSSYKYMGAGVALLALLAQPSHALAQAPAEKDTALVVKSEWGGVRAPRQGDNDIGVMPLSHYMQHYPYRDRTTGEVDRDKTVAAFRGLQLENRDACARTGSWIKRSIDFIGRADTLTGRNQDINNRLVALGDDLNNAARARTGANIISTVLLCTIRFVTTGYCGGVVAQGLSNQAQGMAYTKQSKLNREQSLLNSDQSQLQLDITLLNLDMSIGWAEMMTAYCLDKHTDATIGNTYAVTSTTHASSYTPPAPPKDPPANVRDWE